MRLDIVAFDGFTDIDVVLPWDLLHRAQEPTWDIRIVGTRATHTSATGLVLPTHGAVDEVGDADVVVVASGRGIRPLVADPAYLARLELDPSRQLVGSMCAGALLLAAKGLLDGLTATTYPTAAAELAAYGVHVVEAPFVRHGNVATAAGCLAAQSLVGWIVEHHLGAARREAVLRSVQPVGQGLGFGDAAEAARAYAR